jgi:hypothetical protein
MLRFFLANMRISARASSLQGAPTTLVPQHWNQLKYTIEVRYAIKSSDGHKEGLFIACQTIERHLRL